MSYIICVFCSSRLVTQCAGYDSRFCCSFGSLDDGVEAFGVGYSNFAQHFPVQGDVGFFTAVDELAVSYASLPARCAQACNPQTPEIPFPAFAVDSSINGRPHSSFLGEAIQPTCGTAMALYCFEDSFLCLVSCGTFSNSWHLSFPLKIFDSLSLLAAADWKEPKPRSKPT